MSEKSISALIEAFNTYKTDGDIAEKTLCFQLDEISKKLARDRDFRQELPTVLPSLWEYLSELWRLGLSGFEEKVSSTVILSLARFTRNLVAEVPKNQEAAFVNEPKIRQLLHRLSSFSLLQESELYPLTRMLVQTISNLITLNEILASQLWTLYTTLSEDQNIIMRLLASPDTRTIISTLVLVLNCIKADVAALKRLISPIGLRIVVLLLDRTETWADQDTQESDESEAFTLVYRVFEAFLEQNFGAILYRSLSLEDEPVTPHQTTFLKMLDSYLRHQQNYTSGDHHSFLAEVFLGLCSYSQRAIRRSLGIGSTAEEDSSAGETTPEELKELDLRLPKASAALILLSQCLTTISLQFQSSHEAYAGYETVVLATRAGGFIVNLVETLRLVDRFLPRIVFGKPAITPGQPSSSLGSKPDTTGFAYLKRDLVRLLGTICHEHKEVQDTIRECGGIPVVMNLCVIDERNPYMQEHALFALRNILHHNPDNQEVVDAMKKLEQG